MPLVCLGGDSADVGGHVGFHVAHGPGKRPQQDLLEDFVGPDVVEMAQAGVEDAGLLVHRSHWVAHAHVRRIAKRGSGWECVMTNDLRIPVSRRNRAKVTEWYGSAGNVVSIASRKAG